MTRRNLIGIGLTVTIGIAMPSFANPFRLEIVPREEWGALEPKNDSDYVLYLRDGSFDMGFLRYLVIHHTAEIPGVGTNPSIQLLQKAHMNTKFSDIAYNWVISKDGKIYNGRPWFVMGAAVGPSLESRMDKKEDGFLDKPWKSLNYGTLNVCLIGDFTKEQPTDKQTIALFYLATIVADLFNNIEGNRIIGHKDFNIIAEDKGVNSIEGYATLCPGNIDDLIYATLLEFGNWREQQKEYKPEKKKENHEDDHFFRQRPDAKFARVGDLFKVASYQV
ncbi:MAG: peptidoglycan recognition family protein [archaeon]